MTGKEVHMIHIEDRHVYRGPGIYVGREMPALGLKGSVLGNRCEGRTREERVANFRSWLWEKMQLRGEEYRELRRIADLCRRKIKSFTAKAVSSLFSYCH
jgi:hypothetical protein